MEGDLIRTQGVKRLWIDGKLNCNEEIDIQIDSTVGNQSGRQFYVDKALAKSIVNHLNKVFNLEGK